MNSNHIHNYSWFKHINFCWTTVIKCEYFAHVLCLAMSSTWSFEAVSQAGAFRFWGMLGHGDRSEETWNKFSWLIVSSATTYHQVKLKNQCISRAPVTWQFLYGTWAKVVPQIIIVKFCPSYYIVIVFISYCIHIYCWTQNMLLMYFNYIIPK